MLVQSPSDLLDVSILLNKTQLEKTLNATSINRSSHEKTSQTLTIKHFYLRVSTVCSFQCPYYLDLTSIALSIHLQVFLWLSG